MSSDVSRRGPAEQPANPERVLREILVAEGLLRDDLPARITRLSGGHSHVTWSASQSDATARLVIKVAQQDGPLAPYDIAHEVAYTRLAHDRGLPSPEVVFASESNALGSPLFVMKFVEGDAPVPREVIPWLRDQPDVTAVGLARQVVQTMLDTGRVVDDSSASAAMADCYRAYVDDAFESLVASIEGITKIPASIALVHRRLVEGAQALGGGPLSLVHGDFRFGNLMLRDGKVAAILDWERAMWGHPLHDLAYLSLPSMRYEGRIAGLVDEGELAELWCDVSGSPIDTRALNYLRAVSIFTELCSCVRALCAYSRGRGRMSLLRILPITARHEVDVLDALDGSLDGILV